MSLESYLRAVPKAELHVHLQGTLRPATLITLARRNGVPLPASNPTDLKEWYAFRSFPHFVQIYETMCRSLRSAEDYELVTYEYGAEMARQNIRYAEVTFTPGVHEWRNVPQDRYLAGLSQGRELARKEFGVEINWVFDIIRDAEQHDRLADYVTHVAIEAMEEGVVALGLSGMEGTVAAGHFVPWFDKARAAGLHISPHAGETAGPESVWDALKWLGAERIGHGVRAIEDPALVTYLAERHVPLEVCPCSNLRLGVFPSMITHPLAALHRSGVVITVNSDDPALFGTTLEDEVASLESEFNLGLTTAEEVILNGVRHAFLPLGRRQTLEQQFRSQMDSLRIAHLGGSSGESEQAA